MLSMTFLQMKGLQAILAGLNINMSDVLHFDMSNDVAWSLSNRC